MNSLFTHTFYETCRLNEPTEAHLKAGAAEVPVIALINWRATPTCAASAPKMS